MISRIRELFRKRGVDRTIYLAVFVLAITGIVMIGSAAVGLSAKYGATYAGMSMLRQGVFVLLGVGLMFFFARTFKTRWINQSSVWFLYAVFIALMFVCLAWSDTKGAHSWIKLPAGFTVQPVEFMKIVMILFLAFCFGELPEICTIPKNISTRKNKRLTNRKIIYCFFIPVIAIFFVAFVTAFVQNDTGSAIVLATICLLLFYCVPLKFYHKMKIISIILLIVGGLSLAFVLPMVLQPHQLNRFIMWLNPFSSQSFYYNTSFQFANGLIAFASGGLFGKGFGASTQKFGYIPEATNDFISAIIAEELGLVGFMILIILPFSIIIYKMFSYGRKITDTKSKLILYGIGIYFFAHLIFNIGGVSGLIPMTGVPLVLVSSGGSSVLSSLIAVGIAQAIIARYNKEQLSKELEK